MKRNSRKLQRAAQRLQLARRYAHHPVCQPYAPQTLRLGRRLVLCRGCTYLGLGTLGGFGFGMHVGAQVFVGGALLAMGLTGFLGSLRPSKWRRPKWLTRLAPAACGSAGATALLRMWPWGIYWAVPSAVAVWWLGKLLYEGIPKPHPCASCPQRDHDLCAGYAPLLRVQRLIWRLATPQHQAPHPHGVSLLGGKTLP